MALSKLALAGVCLTSVTFAAAFAAGKKPEKKETKAVNTNMVTVTLETSMGAIELELNKEKAPKTVENFLDYVKSGHYNGTIFHRVIDGFMVQGGGMDAKMAEKATKAPVVNEGMNGLLNEKYTVAMARTNAPDSATAQFFINVENNTFLNAAAGRPGYAVFGKVTKGTEIVDKMAKVKTGNAGMHENVPKEAITITTAKVAN